MVVRSGHRANDGKAVLFRDSSYNCSIVDSGGILHPTPFARMAKMTMPLTMSLLQKGLVGEGSNCVDGHGAVEHVVGEAVAVAVAIAFDVVFAVPTLNVVRSWTVARRGKIGSS